MQLLLESLERAQSLWSGMLVVLLAPLGRTL